ncbi:Hypothetical_protein [Hexamita inflata]|uniref:Hypothetical_protein n=1 Tax=Hexamita inflata TaxID=28002 RepID=A0AA86QBA6_9EUKA|nr:Hypothetical protein HINF_LOCUS41486 [Hexamita inflata]
MSQTLLVCLPVLLLLINTGITKPWLSNCKYCSLKSKIQTEPSAKPTPTIDFPTGNHFTHVISFLVYTSVFGEYQFSGYQTAIAPYLFEEQPTTITVMGGGIAFSCLLCEQLYIKIFCHFQCG